MSTSSPSDRQARRTRIDVVSSKAAAAFDEVIADIERRFAPSALAQWVELGCVIASGSAVAAIKYFRESPSWCDLTPSSRVDSVLEVGLAFAREAPNVSLEFIRQAPQLSERLDETGLRQWAAIGLDVTRRDYGTGIEYVKESGALVGLIPIADFALWADLGLRLAREDLTVKDYLALEYFRSSAEWLGQVPVMAFRSLLLALTARLAAATLPAGSPRRPGQAALDVLRYGHVFLRSLPSPEIQRAVLTLGAAVIERAPSVASEFLRQVPEIVRLVDGSEPRLTDWVNEGLTIADTHLERAEAYFALRSKQSREVAQRLSRGVALRDVKQALTLFAEALCGRPIEIRSGTGAASGLGDAGGVITLPAHVIVYATPEENFRFYKMLTVHEAGHLEFGTYQPVSPEVARWFGAPGLPDPSVPELGSLLDRFPDRALAQNLWTIVEEARIDFRLRHEYAGIRTEMDRVMLDQLRGRPKLDTLARRSAILEALFQLSIADTAEVPLPILEVVTEGYELIKRVRVPHATVEDTLRVVFELYPHVAEGLSTPDPPASPPLSDAPQPPVFDELAMGHAPIESFAFREALAPPQVSQIGQHGGAPSEHRPTATRVDEGAAEPIMAAAQREPEHGQDTAPARGGATDDGCWYDEWDTEAQAYRPRWCRVDERPADEAGDHDLDTIVADARGTLTSLRRYFEVLRPEAFRKIRQQTEGDDIDLEAAVAASAERRAGLSPSERLYTRRDKKTRDVSVALLIDASGSTSRRLAETAGRSQRVIDVEREALVLLAAALDALGDEYAFYAFSGQSRTGVRCLVLKAFDAPQGPSVLGRIGGLRPMGQNRDGAAIRHVTQQLRLRAAAVKLLIVLSDGRPLDDEYAGAYALDDTKVALREARALGIRPFCITVDDAAERYIQTVYGDVSYTIIRDVASLPQRLPHLYKRLTT